jgi:hypothetical protein
VTIAEEHEQRLERLCDPDFHATVTSGDKEAIRALLELNRIRLAACQAALDVLADHCGHDEQLAEAQLRAAIAGATPSKGESNP